MECNNDRVPSPGNDDMDDINIANLSIKDGGEQRHIASSSPRQLTEDDVEKLGKQDTRGWINDFQRNKLEQQAAANWDKFYLRNETR